MIVLTAGVMVLARIRMFAVSVLLVAAAVGVAGLPATVSGEIVRASPGAGGSAPPPPTTPVVSTLSAELSASRLFAGNRTVLLKVSNPTPAAVEISGARLSTDLYAGPQQWIPARPEPVRLRSGGTVSLPIPLADPVCPPDGAHAAELSGPLASVDLPSGTVELETSDPRGDFPALHHQDCVQQGMDAVARLRTAPQLEVAPDGRAAVVRVLIDPGGTGSLVLHRIDATPLLASGGPPWPSEVTVRGTDPPRELALTIVPQRCDAHALAEDKLGTHLPLTLTVGGYSGQVRLAPPAEFTAAVYRFVQQACAAR